MHFIEGCDGLAFETDFLNIRAALNRTSNQFEGMVSTYFCNMDYPLKKWSERLLNFNLDDRLAVEYYFYKVWPHHNLDFNKVVENLAAYWSASYKHNLCYPLRTKKE